MKSQGLKLGRLGFFLLAVAVIFFVVAMMVLAPQSNNPPEVMRIAGQTSGVAAGIGIVLIVVDLLRRRKG